jgi:hypothetical protein
MMCNLFYMVNRMLTDYKTKHCGYNANTKKCIRLIVAGHDRTPKAGSPGNPDRYPLAQLDDSCVPGQESRPGLP